MCALMLKLCLPLVMHPSLSFFVVHQKLSVVLSTTLSSSLYTYIVLLSHVDALFNTPVAQANADLQNGLSACQAKLQKYLDQSSADSTPHSRK